jgi:signal transduction histidine kinase
MDVHYLNVLNKSNLNQFLITMKTKASLNERDYLHNFMSTMTQKSDTIINYVLAFYFLFGIALAFKYDTWEIGVGVGALNLIAYYSAKFFLKKSKFYQYVLSVVLAIFMAQYIYQMHGLFEMHFTVFIASTILIIYQNWKLQIPLTLLVVLHHGALAYLQNFVYNDANGPQIYFSQVNFDIETFIIHVVLAAVVFFMNGYWSYYFKEHSENHISKISDEYELENIKLASAKYSSLSANNEFNSFIYKTSQDLKSPVHSVLTLIEVSKGQTDNEKLLGYFEMIKENTKKIDGLVNDIHGKSANHMAN